MNIAQRIVLSPQEEAVLDQWIHGKASPVRLVQRAKIIRLSADGVFSHDIAQKLQVSRPTVQLWRERFIALRLKGLEKDAPRPGRKPVIRQQKVNTIVKATLQTEPTGASYWSLRAMARAQGVSKDSVWRIWKQHNLKPHLAEIPVPEADLSLSVKEVDIAGIYLNPPQKALVLCVNPKSLTQTSESGGHHSARQAVSALFGALGMLEGRVAGDVIPKYRPHEFIRFLKSIDNEIPAGFDLIVISGDQALQEHKGIKAWLKRHPRFHCIQGSGPWPGLPESVLEKAGSDSFNNVPKAVRAIMDYMESQSQNPGVFVWSGSKKDHKAG
jgi:transposase